MLTLLSICAIFIDMSFAESDIIYSDDLLGSTSVVMNLNTATEQELTRLDAIDDIRAAAIVAYREEHGKFTSVQELLNIKSIGEKTLDCVRHYVVAE